MFNSFLIGPLASFRGPLASVLVPLQSVLYTVARVIFLKYKSDLVTTLLKILQKCLVLPSESFQTVSLEGFTRSLQNLKFYFPFHLLSLFPFPAPQLPASAIFPFIHIVSIIYVAIHPINQAYRDSGDIIGQPNASFHGTSF